MSISNQRRPKRACVDINTRLDISKLIHYHLSRSTTVPMLVSSWATTTIPARVVSAYKVSAGAIVRVYVPEGTAQSLKLPDKVSHTVEIVSAPATVKTVVLAAAGSTMPDIVPETTTGSTRITG